MPQFDSKVVMLTGAASGFGRAAALAFAQRGAKLVLSDINETALAEVAAAVGDAGAEVVAMRADVSHADDLEAQVERAVAEFGALDIAINNAGIAHPLARLHELTPEDFQRVVSTNAGGVFHGMKFQLPVMMKQKGGVILNVASIAGLIGSASLSVYAASKHAVMGLTRSAADEYARYGIRVNAVCPGFSDTPMYDSLADSLSSKWSIDRETTDRRITHRVPMNRTATTDEVVSAMLWLCADENSFMTGQAIPIDGGLTAV